MKIRTLWETDKSGDMPWLVTAYDEYTEEAHNGTPEFYQKELDQNQGNRRELMIIIPDAAVQKLFTILEVPGKIS